MGMFDTITCEATLPAPEHQALEFQTKDLECSLDHYEITRDGRLVRKPRRGSGGPERDVTWPLHGDLRFYTSTGEGEARQWIEYVARFSYGRLDWIRPHEEGAELDDKWEPASIEPTRENAKAARAENAGSSPSPRPAEELLLENLRRRAADLDALLESCSDHWGFEDPVYRFYHQSYKVYGLQGKTREIVATLQELAPERPLHRWFLDIVEQGTGHDFEIQHNADWAVITRPILDAFFHARYFLEMAVRYAYLKCPPTSLPSGYAALLELYGLR